MRLPVHGPFAEAFDHGEVTWVDDQPVFSVRVAAQPKVAVRHALQAMPAVQPRTLPARRVAPAPPWTEPAPPGAEPGLTPMHLAWLLVLPVVVVAMVAGLLAPALARWLLPAATWSGLPSVRDMSLIAPEADEQLRYMIALGSAVLLVALVGLAWRQLSGLRRGRRLAVAVMVVQVAGVALAAASLYQQERYRHWFSGWDVVAGLGIAGVLLLAARSGPKLLPGIRAAVASQPVRRRRAIGALTLALVVTVTGLWLLPAVFHDGNVADAEGAVRGHLQFTFDEFASASNGRTALVDFIPQYSRLLHFVVQPVFALFGATVGTFTWTMWVFSTIAMVAVYMMFRVVTGGPVTALVPYAPFLAVSMVAVKEAGDQRITLSNLYGVVPLRVLGPFLLACFCALQLRRPHRAGPLALFSLAGLVAINNPEFGLPAFLGLGLALWCGRDHRVSGSRQAVVLVAQAVVGALVAVAIVSAFTLVRTSALPRLDYVNHFARIFAVEGFGMVRMPLLGLHVVVYMTFVGALVAGLAGSIEPSPSRSRIVTGMLAYSGVLGLGAFSYWVGRSHPDALFGMFPTWGLSVGLLGWWVLSAVARRSTGKPAPSFTVRALALPSLSVLVAFGLMLLLFRQFPSPGEQLQRVTSGAESRATGLPRAPYEAPATFDVTEASSFVSSLTEPGEAVAILGSLGHAVAEESKVVNVSPYAHPDVIVFTEQMAFFLEAVEEARATKIFLGPTYPEIATFLRLSGYSMTEVDPVSRLTVWERSA